MPYDLVDFDAARKKLEDALAKAKAQAPKDTGEEEKDEDENEEGGGADGGDEPKDVEIDDAVIDSLTDLVGQGVRIEEDAHRRVREAHQRAKRLVDEIERLVKKRGKKVDDADVAELEGKKGEIEEAEQEAKKALDESSTALVQFRKDFAKSWRPLLSHPMLVNPALRPRTRVAKYPAEDLQSHKRIGEYIKRAESIVKLGNTAAGRGMADSANQAKEITDFTTSVKQYADKIAKAGLPVTKTLTTKVLTPIETMRKKKVRPDLKTVQVWEKMLVEAEARAKPLRGELKSLETLMVTFKKSAALFESANRKTAQTAYTTAAKDFKAAATRAKELATAQAKGKKAVALARKNVKK